MNQSISVCVVVLILCLSPRLAIIGSAQVMINTTMLQENGGRNCAPMDERERALNEIRQTAKSVINDTICGSTPGWRRVAFINMTDTSYSCPTGLNLTFYSKRTCGRSNVNAGCSSTTFDVGGLPYSRVCGRIKGYQFGGTIAFYDQLPKAIDSYYVSGVSLTHGSVGSRKHIWTFAAGLTEIPSSYPSAHCPCDALYSGTVPSFVGNDYFCESGLNSAWIDGQFIFRPNDPLWDGQNCTDTSTCCEFNNPPWFTKELNASTTNNIELRICSDIDPQYDDVLLELIELYVQ